MEGVWAQAILSTGLGAVFLTSSVPKLRRPRSFAVTVLAYDVLPRRVAKLYALALPPVEFLLALMLLLGLCTRAAGAGASLLTISFLIGVGANVARGRDLNCGCFGESGRKIGWGLLVQDGLLMCGTLTLVALDSQWISVAPWSVFRAVHPWTMTGLMALSFCVVIALGRPGPFRGVQSRERRWRLG
jgi:uncharacterized membrane protein YphA (DoxX/SURF4 family)